MIYTHTEIKKDTEEKFIPLTNDLLFKETFGNPRNIKYLESLLESYYGFNEGYLSGKVKVSYETNIDKDTYSEMANRCDLIATINDEYLVNLEMYSEFNSKSLTKSDVYIMKISTSQLKRGSKYYNFKKVTQINFIGKLDKSFEITEKFQDTYQITEDSRNYKQEFILLENIKNIDYNNDIFIRWLWFLSSKTSEERREVAEGDKLFMGLNEWLEDYLNDESLREVFDDRKWNKIIAHESGRLEQQQEMVKNMLKENISIETIQKVSNLSIEEIEKLKEE